MAASLTQVHSGPDMNLAEGITELRRLNAHTDQFVGGVTIPANELVGRVEKGYYAILRAFLGALLLGAHSSESRSLWPLLTERLPPDLLACPEIQNARPLLSEPLSGNPSSVLTVVKLLNEKSDWHRVNLWLRASLTEDQRYVMRLLDEELMI